jgi:hypothetical protein
VVARVVSVPHHAVIASGAAAAGALVAAVLAWRVQVDSFAAAAQLDIAEGLKERLSTTVEVAEKGGSGEVVEALLADAVSVARKTSPEASLTFHAPRTLPLTLALVIAAAALVLAPQTASRAESSLPPVVRVALKEAVRMDITSEMLKESGAPQDLVRQIEELSRLLKKSDADSVEITLQAVRAAQTAVQKNLEAAARRDTALEEMRNSGALGRLTDLLSSGAPAEELSAEAAAVIEKSAPEAAQLLAEVLEKLADGKMRRKLQEALKALEERDLEAFARSMQEFAREARKLPGTEELGMTRERLSAAAAKLGAAKNGTQPAAPAGIGPEKNGAAAPGVGEGTALEGAMEKEKVPERFRSLVSAYFARSGMDQRRRK